MLRDLDREEIGGIAVMPIPDRELGEAINDRLKRAAEPEMAAPEPEASVPCRSPQRAG
jgi:hypothetical protein